MTRTFFVGGNFKMNGSTESIKKIVDGLNAADLPASVDVVVAPPFPYVGLTKSLVTAKTVGVSGQNIYAKSAGAFTGETSPEMLKDLGAEWVILGHSERRTIFGESSELVAEKTKFALESGLKVIFCIGETKEERESNKTFEVVSSQTQAAIDVLTTEQWKNVVIAYEPVWAIGTGLTASPEDAQEVHAQLREFFAKKVSPEAAAAVRIIYGGSVNGASAPGLAGKPDIDGFLVGGASLKPEFIDIIKAGAN